MKALIPRTLFAPLLAGSMFLVAAPHAAAQPAAAPGCPGGASAASARCGDSATSPGPGSHGMGMGMGMGTGTGMGQGMGQGMGMAGPVPMSLMTPAERMEHQSRMSSFKSFEECRAYVDDLHKKLATRARERGVTMPSTPVHDPCADLPRLKP